VPNYLTIIGLFATFYVQFETRIAVAVVFSGISRGEKRGHGPQTHAMKILLVFSKL